ncbi:MAG TPA: Spy/CpxP family protein refolding chaperone [Candidatus Binatia bacterium]|nr:Spy/CpxP family protein refolding chaperone [Candidatus Binatia bacterium]
MYPGFHSWWRFHHAGGRRAYAGCGSAWAAHGGWSESERAREGDAGFFFGHRDDPSDLAGGAFGVRRPLRFLAYKLGLDERQVGEMARILDDLKTERAQAEVDRRRTVAAFADAVGGAEFDAARASEGASLRVQSAERLRDAVMRALARIHSILDAEQRDRLAVLIRTGTLQI